MSIKSIFKDLASYAKEHKWQTTIALASFAVGLALIAGGIVLAATAPATYGGGAAVGIPLLGIGAGLAAGAIVVAAGVVTTGCATGFLWKSSRHHAQRRELRKKVKLANESMQITPILKKPDKKTEQEKTQKVVHFQGVLPDEILPDQPAKRSSLWKRASVKQDKKFPKSETESEGEGEGENPPNLNKPS